MITPSTIETLKRLVVTSVVAAMVVTMPGTTAWAKVTSEHDPKNAYRSPYLPGAGQSQLDTAKGALPAVQNLRQAEIAFNGGQPNYNQVVAAITAPGTLKNVNTGLSAPMTGAPTPQADNILEGLINTVTGGADSNAIGDAVKRGLLPGTNFNNLDVIPRLEMMIDHVSEEVKREIAMAEQTYLDWYTALILDERLLDQLKLEQTRINAEINKLQVERAQLQAKMSSMGFQMVWATFVDGAGARIKEIDRILNQQTVTLPDGSRQQGLHAAASYLVSQLIPKVTQSKAQDAAQEKAAYVAYDQLVKKYGTQAKFRSIGDLKAEAGTRIQTGLKPKLALASTYQALERSDTLQTIADNSIKLGGVGVLTGIGMKIGAGIAEALTSKNIATASEQSKKAQQLQAEYAQSMARANSQSELHRSYAWARRMAEIQSKEHLAEMKAGTTDKVLHGLLMARDGLKEQLAEVRIAVADFQKLADKSLTLNSKELSPTVRAWVKAYGESNLSIAANEFSNSVLRSADTFMQKTMPYGDPFKQAYGQPVVQNYPYQTYRDNLSTLNTWTESAQTAASNHLADTVMLAQHGNQRAADALNNMGIAYLDNTGKPLTSYTDASGNTFTGVGAWQMANAEGRLAPQGDNLMYTMGQYTDAVMTQAKGITERLSTGESWGMSVRDGAVYAYQHPGEMMLYAPEAIATATALALGTVGFIGTAPISVPVAAAGALVIGSGVVAAGAREAITTPSTESAHAAFAQGSLHATQLAASAYFVPSVAGTVRTATRAATSFFADLAGVGRAAKELTAMGGSTYSPISSAISTAVSSKEGLGALYRVGFAPARLMADAASAAVPASLSLYGASSLASGSFSPEGLFGALTAPIRSLGHRFTQAGHDLSLKVFGDGFITNYGVGTLLEAQQIAADVSTFKTGGDLTMDLFKAYGATEKAAALGSRVAMEVPMIDFYRGQANTWNSAIQSGDWNQIGHAARGTVAMALGVGGAGGRFTPEQVKAPSVVRSPATAAIPRAVGIETVKLAGVAAVGQLSPDLAIAGGMAFSRVQHAYDAANAARFGEVSEMLQWGELARAGEVELNPVRLESAARHLAPRLEVTRDGSVLLGDRVMDRSNPVVEAALRVQEASNQPSFLNRATNRVAESFSSLGRTMAEGWSSLAQSNLVTNEAGRLVIPGRSPAAIPIQLGAKPLEALSFDGVRVERVAEPVTRVDQLRTEAAVAREQYRQAETEYARVANDKASTPDVLRAAQEALHSSRALQAENYARLNEAVAAGLRAERNAENAASVDSRIKQAEARAQVYRKSAEFNLERAAEAGRPEQRAMQERAIEDLFERALAEDALVVKSAVQDAASRQAYEALKTKEGQGQKLSEAEVDVVRQFEENLVQGSEVKMADAFVRELELVKPEAVDVAMDILFGNQKAGRTGLLEQRFAEQLHLRGQEGHLNPFKLKWNELQTGKAPELMEAGLNIEATMSAGKTLFNTRAAVTTLVKGTSDGAIILTRSPTAIKGYESPLTKTVAAVFGRTINNFDTTSKGERGWLDVADNIRNKRVINVGTWTEITQFGNQFMEASSPQARAALREFLKWAEKARVRIIVDEAHEWMRETTEGIIGGEGESLHTEYSKKKAAYDSLWDQVNSDLDAQLIGENVGHRFVRTETGAIELTPELSAYLSRKGPYTVDMMKGALEAAMSSPRRGGQYNMEVAIDASPNGTGKLAPNAQLSGIQAERVMHNKAKLVFMAKLYDDMAIRPEYHGDPNLIQAMLEGKRVDWQATRVGGDTVASTGLFEVLSLFPNGEVNLVSGTLSPLRTFVRILTGKGIHTEGNIAMIEVDNNGNLVQRFSKGAQDIALRFDFSENTAGAIDKMAGKSAEILLQRLGYENGNPNNHQGLGQWLGSSRVNEHFAPFKDRLVENLVQNGMANRSSAELIANEASRLGFKADPFSGRETNLRDAARLVVEDRVHKINEDTVRREGYVDAQAEAANKLGRIVMVNEVGFVGVNVKGTGMKAMALDIQSSGKSMAEQFAARVNRQNGEGYFREGEAILFASNEGLDARLERLDNLYGDEIRDMLQRADFADVENPALAKQMREQADQVIRFIEDYRNGRLEGKNEAKLFLALHMNEAVEISNAYKQAAERIYNDNLVRQPFKQWLMDLEDRHGLESSVYKAAKKIYQEQVLRHDSELNTSLAQSERGEIKRSSGVDVLESKFKNAASQVESLAKIVQGNSALRGEFNTFSKKFDLHGIREARKNYKDIEILTGISVREVARSSDPNRVSMLVGLVKNMEGEVLSGVATTHYRPTSVVLRQDAREKVAAGGTLTSRDLRHIKAAAISDVTRMKNSGLPVSQELATVANADLSNVHEWVVGPAGVANAPLNAGNTLLGASQVQQANQSIGGFRQVFNDTFSQLRVQHYSVPMAAIEAFNEARSIAFTSKLPSDVAVLTQAQAYAQTELALANASGKNRDGLAHLRKIQIQNLNRLDIQNAIQAQQIVDQVLTDLKSQTGQSTVDDIQQRLNNVVVGAAHGPKAKRETGRGYVLTHNAKADVPITLVVDQVTPESKLRALQIMTYAAATNTRVRIHVSNKLEELTRAAEAARLRALENGYSTTQPVGDAQVKLIDLTDGTDNRPQTAGFAPIQNGLAMLSEAFGASPLPSLNLNEIVRLLEQLKAKQQALRTSPSKALFTEVESLSHQLNKARTQLRVSAPLMTQAGALGLISLPASVQEVLEGVAKTSDANVIDRLVRQYAEQTGLIEEFVGKQAAEAIVNGDQLRVVQLDYQAEDGPTRAQQVITALQNLPPKQSKLSERLFSQVLTAMRSAVASNPNINAAGLRRARDGAVSAHDRKYFNKFLLASIESVLNSVFAGKVLSGGLLKAVQSALDQAGILKDLKDKSKNGAFGPVVLVVESESLIESARVAANRLGLVNVYPITAARYAAYQKALKTEKEKSEKLLTNVAPRESYATQQQTLQAASSIVTVGVAALVAAGFVTITVATVAGLVVSLPLTAPAMLRVYKAAQRGENPLKSLMTAASLRKPLVSPFVGMGLASAIVLATVAVGGLVYGTPIAVGGALIHSFTVILVGGNALSFMLGAFKFSRSTTLNKSSAGGPDPGYRRLSRRSPSWFSGVIRFVTSPVGRVTMILPPMLLLANSVSANTSTSGSFIGALLTPAGLVVGGVGLSTLMGLSWWYKRQHFGPRTPRTRISPAHRLAISIAT